MASPFYSSPADELDYLNQIAARDAAIKQLENVLTGDDALNAANFARYYTTASDELTAAVAQSAMSWDIPLLQDVVDVEREEGWRPWNAALNAVKNVSRHGFNTIESIWENGFSRPIRTGVRMYQGENIGDAFMRAGAGPMDRMIRAKSQGKDYDLGQGWFPQPQEDQPVSQQQLRDFKGYLDEQENPSQQTIESAWKAASPSRPDVREKVDIYGDYWEAAENTLVTRTEGDKQYTTPVSFGRLAAVSIVRPDTIPFTIMSGTLDGVARVGLDPLNVPADELTAFVKARRLVVPTNELEDLTQFELVNRLRKGHMEMKAIEGSEAWGQTYSFPQLEAPAIVDAEKAKEAYRSRTFVEVAEKGLNPYWDAIDDAGLTIDEFYALVDEAGGEDLAVDLTIEHERAHQADVRIHDTTQQNYLQLWNERHLKGRIADQLEIEFNALPESAQAGPQGRALLNEYNLAADEFNALNEVYEQMWYQTEYRTQKKMIDNFLKGDLYAPKVRAAELKSLGLHRKWRFYVEPTTPDRWAGRRSGQRTLQFLADTESPYDIMKILGDTPAEVQRAVKFAKTPDDVLNVLKPHFGGRGLTQYPGVGKMKALGARVPLDAKKGAAGGYSILEDDSRLGMYVRRMTANTTAGGTVLDPMNTTLSMRNATNFLETLGASRGEIDEVLTMILNTHNDFGRMMKVSKRMEGLVEARLVALGESPDDVRHIMTTYRDESILHTVYIDDVMGNPIHVVGSVVVDLKNGADETLQYVVDGAAREAQFSGRNIILPSVRDVRIATGKLRVMQDKLRNLYSTKLAPGFSKPEAEAMFGSWLRYKTEQVMSVWRNAALLRFGWPLRVLPDEYLRVLASGYSDMFANPASYIVLALMDGQGFTGSMDDWVRMKGGLGTGTLARGLDNQQLQGTRHLLNRASFVKVNLGEYGHAQGVTRNLNQLHVGRLEQMLLRPFRVTADDMQTRFRVWEDGEGRLRLFRARDIQREVDSIPEAVSPTRAYAKKLEKQVNDSIEAGNGDIGDIVDPDIEWRTLGGTEDAIPYIEARSGVGLDEVPEKVYHGTSTIDLETFVDVEGNLHLRSASNFDGQVNSVSFGVTPEVADFYRIRRRGHTRRSGGRIFEVDSDALPNVGRESIEEVAINTTEDVVIPKGKWKAYDARAENEAIINALDSRNVESATNPEVYAGFLDELEASEALEYSGADDLEGEALRGVFNDPEIEFWFREPYTAELIRRYHAGNFSRGDFFAMTPEARGNMFMDPDNWDYLEQVFEAHKDMPGMQPQLPGWKAAPVAELTPEQYARLQSGGTVDLGDATIDEVIDMLWAMNEPGNPRSGRSLTPLGREVLEDIANQAGNASILQDMVQSPAMTRRGLEMIDFEIATNAGGKGYYRYMDDEGRVTGVWKDELGRAVDDYTDPTKWDGRTLRAELTRLGVKGRSKATTKEQMARLLREHNGVPHFDEIPTTQQFIVTDAGSSRVREVIRSGVDEELGPLFKENMTVRDWENAEALIYDLYDDTHPVRPAVHAPDEKVQKRMDSFGHKFVERMFLGIGAAPTIHLLRNPMFKMRYIENLARSYLWTDELTRVRMLSWADELGVRSQFDTFVTKQAKAHGLKKAPAAGPLGRMTAEQIDELAKFEALDHVKSLLYDLSESNNVADAMRVVFPFADAWWEVISRWAGLFNPKRMGGQALRNVRRPEQLAYQARRDGWFQEDEFGNEVMNLPIPFGGHEFGGFKVQPQVGVNQFMFVDPGNPRSWMAPGTSPGIQLAAAFAEPHLPTPIRDIMKQAVAGDFNLPNVNSVSGIILGVLPTPYKRAIQKFINDEQREDMASEKISAYYGLCNSRDSRFDCNTPEGSKRAMEEADSVAGTLGWLRIFEAVGSPAQPQHKMMVNVGGTMGEVNRLAANTETFDFWLSTSALSEEYRVARELMGQEAATEYMINRFGVDPLDLGSLSRAVVPRPATHEAFKTLEQNPELYDYAYHTLMAFLPQDEDDPFYVYAYNKQLQDGDRVKYESPEDVAQLQSLNKGNRAYAHNKEVYDAQAKWIKEQYAMYPATRKREMDKLDKWWSQTKFDIGQQYTQWAEGVELKGIVGRPGYGNYLEEMRDIAVLGSDANTALKAINPDLVAFIEGAMELWEEAERYSIDRSNSSKWWRRAPLERDLDPGEVDSAAQIQEWFTRGLEWHLQRVTDPIAITGAQWLADRVFTPALGTYDLNDPLEFDQQPPPAPSDDVVQGDTIDTTGLIGAAP